MKFNYVILLGFMYFYLLFPLMVLVKHTLLVNLATNDNIIDHYFVFNVLNLIETHYINHKHNKLS